jgi:PAS domain S-box-containing protein
LPLFNIGGFVADGISDITDGKSPVYRERSTPDFELFREVTRRLDEKDNLIKAQSVELLSKLDEINRQEARIALLLDCCPVGVIFICNRIIEYVNNKISEITGYPKADIVGKNSRFLYETAEEWDEVGRVQESAARTAKVKVNFKRKDGTFVSCELQMTRVTDVCDHEFVVLVYSDA